MANELLLSDRNHTRLDFYKKPTDVSYLIETQKFGNEKSMNDYFSKTINRSANLLSPKKQGSFLNKTLSKFKPKQNSEDISQRLSPGKDYGRKLINTLGFELNNSETGLPMAIEKLKEFASLDTEPEGDFPILKTRSPRKIVDSVTAGYGVNDYLEMKDAKMKDEIKKVKDKVIIQHRSQNKNLSLPSGRKDVIMLSDWLNQMLEKIYKEEKIKTEKAFENVQLIYTVCLQELIRQVKVQCVERGQLFEKIWEAYIDLFDRVIQEHNKAIKEMENYYLGEIEQIHKMYHIRLERTIIELENVKKQRDEDSSLLETKKEEMRFLKKKTQKLDSELRSQKIHAEELGLEMERLKAENVELKKIVFDSGLQLSNRYAEAKKIVDIKTEAKKATKKLKKGQILQDLFDPLRDKLLYENLNMIDELEDELAGKNVLEEETENDGDNPTKENIKENEEIYRHIGIDTEDLITTAEVDIQVERSTEEKYTQFENFVDENKVFFQENTNEELEADVLNGEEKILLNAEEEETSGEGENVHIFEILCDIDEILAQKLKGENNKDIKYQLTYLLLNLLKTKLKLRSRDYEKLIKHLIEKQAQDSLDSQVSKIQSTTFGKIQESMDKEQLWKMIEKVYAQLPKISRTKINGEADHTLDEIVELTMSMLRGNEITNIKDLKTLFLQALRPKHKKSEHSDETNLPFVDVMEDYIIQSTKDIDVKSMTLEEKINFLEDIKRRLGEQFDNEASPKVDRQLLRVATMIVDGSQDIPAQEYKNLLGKTLKSFSQMLGQVTALRVENEEQIIDIQELKDVKDKYERRIDKLQVELKNYRNKAEYTENQYEKLNNKFLKLKNNAEETKDKHIQKLAKLIQTMNKFKTNSRLSKTSLFSLNVNKTIGEEDIDSSKRKVFINVTDYDKTRQESMENPGMEEQAKENNDYSDDQIMNNIVTLINEEPEKEEFEEDETWSENDELKENETKRKSDAANIDQGFSSIVDAKVLSMRRDKSKKQTTTIKPLFGISFKMLRVLSMNADSANALLMRVRAKKNIKNGLPKQTVLKFIAQIYLDRLKALSSIRKVPLYIVAYDSFMNKYGLKKVAETKCQQMFESVFLYPENLRIQRFKDFLGLGECYDSDELELYFSTIKQVDSTGNGISIVSNLNEKTWILMENAEQAASNLFGKKIDPQALKFLMSRLNQLKVSDNKSSKPMIEFEDVFTEFLAIQRNLEDKVKRFVKDIFNAADVKIY